MSKTFLEALTSVGKNLQSGVDKLKETSTDFINIKSLGAKGDGSTDDYDIINSAFGTYDSIYFPSGTYYCGSDILIGAYGKDINIKGNNAEIIFSENMAIGFDVYCNSLIMDGMSFNYTATSSPRLTGSNQGVLFRLCSCNEATIENCSFVTTDTRDSSVTERANYTAFWGKAQGGSLKNMYFRHCVFENTTGGTIGGSLWINTSDIASYSVENIKIEECDFKHEAYDEALAVWGENGATIKDIIISKNKFIYSGNYRNGTFISLFRDDSTYYIYNTIFSDNIVRADEQYGECAISGFIRLYNTNCIISNNHIFVKSNYVGGEKSLLKFDGDTNVIITSNKIDMQNDGSSYFSLINSLSSNVKFTKNNVSITGDAVRLYWFNDCMKQNIDFSDNILNLLLSGTSSKQLYFRVSENGSVKFKGNTLNATYSTDGVSYYLEFNGVSVDSSGVETEEDSELIISDNRLYGLPMYLKAGNNNGLKRVYVDKNISDNELTIYPYDSKKMKSISITENYFSTMTYNWATMTLTALTNIFSYTAITNNRKYETLEDITVS